MGTVRPLPRPAPTTLMSPSRGPCAVGRVATMNAVLPISVRGVIGGGGARHTGRALAHRDGER